MRLIKSFRKKLPRSRIYMVLALTGWIGLWILVSKLIWFQDTDFLATGDFAPLLSSHENLWYRVVDLQSASQMTYQNTIRFFPYYSFAMLAEALGLALTDIEVLWLGINFALPAITMYFFLKNHFTGASNTHILISSLIYNLNFLVLNNILIVRPVWTLYYTLPLGLFLLDKVFKEVFEENRKNMRASTFLLGLIFSSLFISILINPPTFVVGLIALLIYLFFKHKQFPFLFRENRLKHLLKYVSSLVIATLIFNLWVIFPLVNNIVFSNSNIGKEVVSMEFLEWTSEQTSLENLFVGKGNYFWGKTSIGGSEYFPYAEYYDNFLVVLALFTFTAFAFWGIRKRRYINLFALTLVCLSLFLAKGLQNPLSDLNKYLFENVSLFWLLRSPFLKVMTLFYFGLSVLYVSTLEGIKRFNKAAHRLLIIFLLILTAIISIPIFTGEIFPGERGELPGAQVEIPLYWFEMAEHINSTQSIERVLISPANTFYQVHYNWEPDGYHAVDIADRIIDKEIITQTPEGGYVSNQDTRKMIEALYDNPENIYLYRALGITHILYRHDYDQGHYQTMPVSEIDFEEVGFNKLIQFGELELFEVGETDQLELSGNVLVSNTFDPEIYEMLSKNYSEVHFIETHENAEKFATIENFTDLETISLEKENLSEYRFISNNSTNALIYINNDSFKNIKIQGRRTDRNQAQIYYPGRIFSINGVQYEVPSRELRLDAGIENNTLLKLNDSYTQFVFEKGEWNNLGQAFFERNNRIEIFKRTNFFDNYLQGLSPSNCYNPENLSLEEAGIRYEKDKDESFRLESDQAKGCLRIPIISLEGTDIVNLKLLAKNNYGKNLEICLWDEDLKECLIKRIVDEKEGFEKIDLYYGTTSEDQRLSLYLYSDALDQVPSSNSIKGLSIGKFERSENNKLVNQIALASSALYEGEDTIVVDNLVQGVNLIETETHDIEQIVSYDFDNFSETIGRVQDCRNTDNLPLESTGISASLASTTADNVSLQLEAKKHLACYRMDLGFLEKNSNYIIEFEAINAKGELADICIKSLAQSSCTQVELLESSYLEQGLGTQRVILKPETDEQYILYLYSKGILDGTINYFDNIRLYEVPKEFENSLVLVTNEKNLDYSSVIRHKIIEDKFFLKILSINQEIEREAILVTEDSYDKSWFAIRINNSSFALDFLSAEHVRTNSFSNGWILRPMDSASIVIIVNISQLIVFALLMLPVFYVLRAILKFIIKKIKKLNAIIVKKYSKF